MATIKIYNRKDLETFRDRVNRGECFLDAKLMNDIDISSEDSNGEPISWVPIGARMSYSGCFDGKGNTVSGLYIDDTPEMTAALFGINAGTVKNLSVRGTVSGHQSCAGICAWNRSENGIASIVNCKNYCSVKGVEVAAGVTALNYGKIIDCENYGEIKGITVVGGIVGHCPNKYFEPHITRCKNFGDIFYETIPDFSYVEANGYKVNQIGCLLQTDRSNQQNGKVVFPFQNSLTGQYLNFLEVYDEEETYNEITNLLRHDPDPIHRNEHGDTYLHLMCRNRSAFDDEIEVPAKLIEILAAETEIDFAAVNKNGKEAADFFRDEDNGKVPKYFKPLVKMIELVKKEQKEQEEEKDVTWSDIGF